MISIKQLRYFEAVARLKHFGDAARDCAITQPALSMQVQELERELGTRLIERNKRQLHLTEAGKNVAERAKRILTEVRELSESTRQNNTPMSGRMDLGVIPSIAPYLLPPLLPVVREQYPECDLHIRETQTEPLIDELLQGTLDLLLLSLPIQHPEIETFNLFDDEFYLATSKGKRISNSVGITPDLLKNNRLLLLEEGHCMRDQALSFCQLQQDDRINTFGASSLSTIVQLVANGMGMTLLPAISVPLEARDGNIRVIRFSQPRPSRKIGICWRKSSPRADDFRQFGKLVCDTAPKRKPL